MPRQLPYEYAIIRAVPRVERGECINVGAIVFCSAKGFLEARIELNQQRLVALDASLDREDIETLQHHLAAIPSICTGGKQAGPIGQLPQRERFRWLTAPRSTIIQTSPAHTGLCQDPASVLEHLLATAVRPL